MDQQTQYCYDVSSKLIYRFNTIPINPGELFVETDKLFLECTWKYEGPKICKAILKKKNNIYELHYLISRLAIKSQLSRQSGVGIKVDI